jgi:hypothetical protein
VAELGKTCLIALVDSTKDGKTYSNIAAIMALPKGTTPPEGTCNELTMHWDMAAPDWAVFAALPARLVEQIEASPEFKALTPPTGRIAAPSPMQAPPKPHAAAAARTPAPAPTAGAGSGFDDFSDDTPF